MPPQCDEKKVKCGCHHANGGVYCLGMIGAAVYYIGHAGSFWLGVWGFIKALVWPAFLVYQALEFITK